MSKSQDSICALMSPKKFLSSRSDCWYNVRGVEVNILDSLHYIHLPHSTSVTSMFSSWGEIVSGVCMLDDPGTVQYLALSPESYADGIEGNHGVAYIRIHSVVDFSGHSTQYPTHESLDWECNNAQEVKITNTHPERSSYHYFGVEKTASVRESGYKDGTPELAMLLTMAPGDWP